jgi:hypothetical protein
VLLLSCLLAFRARGESLREGCLELGNVTFELGPRHTTGFLLLLEQRARLHSSKTAIQTDHRELFNRTKREGERTAELWTKVFSGRWDSVCVGRASE